MAVRRRIVIDDRVLLIGLFFLLGAFASCILTLPPTGRSFELDRAPTATVLNGFYGVEMNAQGAFRWSKPEATIAVPVGAPGRYRVIVTLQDSPANAPARQVTLAGDDATTTFQADTTLKGYALDLRLTPRAWAATLDHNLTIALRTAPYLPVGDQRALGMIVSPVEVVPLGAALPDWSVLLPVVALPALAGTLYGATRSSRAVLILVGTIVLIIGAFAIVARDLALTLLYLPALNLGPLRLA